MARYYGTPNDRPIILWDYPYDLPNRTEATMVKKYRALVDMGLRKSPDSLSPLYGEWHEWRAGQEFAPPKHMNVERALARGIMEEVKSDG